MVVSVENCAKHAHDRTVGQLTSALARLPQAELAGQPLPLMHRSDDRYELLAKLQGVLAAIGYPGVVVIVDRLDEPHLINGSAERMKQVIWPLLDNKFLKSPGLGFKLLLPVELYRFIEREDEQFNQRARLDKQNLVPSLEWTGETLYDIASARVKAARVGESPASLSGLLSLPSISDDYLTACEVYEYRGNYLNFFIDCLWPTVTHTRQNFLRIKFRWSDSSLF